MRRIWNSWTYYGNGESTRQQRKEASQDSWRTIGWTGTDATNEDEKNSKGALERAYERSPARFAPDEIERAMDLYDVRRERVARVKQAIENGNYRISARELAQRLIRNMRGDYH